MCEAHNNPADFFLDVINGDSTAVASVADVADQYGGKQPSLPLPRRGNIVFFLGGVLEGGRVLTARIS